MEQLTQAFTLISSVVRIAGIVLLAWGVITIGTNAKDHNGPAISQGVWQTVGGALVILAAELIKTAAG